MFLVIYMLKTIVIILLLIYLLLTVKYVNRTSSETTILTVDAPFMKGEFLNDRQPLYIKSIVNTDDSIRSWIDPQYTMFYHEDVVKNGLKQNCSDGLIVQSSGDSNVYLFDPTQTGNLYPVGYLHSFSSWEADSRIDPSQPDLNHYPKYENSEYTVALLKSGDALYIPFGWWWYIPDSDSEQIKIVKWNRYLSIVMRPVYLVYRHFAG